MENFLAAVVANMALLVIEALIVRMARQLGVRPFARA
jgi:hypothetical protein